MSIGSLFKSDITRSINPAVVVSNKNEETVKAEISEYVFTDELIEKLYDFLYTFVNNKDKKTGIWINGYYGSGKSHFIKYAHYCLNPDTSDDAFEHFLANVKEYQQKNGDPDSEVTESNVNLLKRKIESSEIDNIMFNVEDETDDGSGERLTRIFLSMFNRFRGYNSADIPLALLFEKYMDRKGKFDEFKVKLKEEHNHDWEEEAAAVASFELKTVLATAKSLVPDLDTDSLHSKLTNPETFRITIKDTLIPEFKEHIKAKDSDYRLLFLVDEVSQYVGGNKDILLNFQNIIERISDDCESKIWVACTAQQSIDEVSQSTNSSDVQDEFGKILGRFDTRISLESSDAAYITQKRVLDKNSDGERILGELYHEKKNALENQFRFHHDLYRGYKGQEEFALAYPFVPYQFRLISDVFEAFQHLQYVIKEVKDNERSVLGITHFTARQNASREVGYFIPFDGFFNGMMEDNLTHLGRKAIDHALALDFKEEKEFAHRVIQCLFMISNLLETKRQTFPSNIDNLTLLLLDTLDQNRLALKKKVQAVLEQLMEKNVVREEKGNYFFFSEDEIQLTSLIKNQTIILEDRLNVLDEMIQLIVKVPNKHRIGQNDFKVSYWVDNKEVYRNGDVVTRFKVLEQADANSLGQLALSNGSNELWVCMNEWIDTDPNFLKDLTWFTKNRKYFRDQSGQATGERAKNIEIFQERNKNLFQRLLNTIEANFSKTRYVSGNEVIDASKVNGNKPRERYQHALEMHIDRAFKYHRLAEDYASTAADLRQRVSLPIDPDFFTKMTEAEQLVDDYISQMGDSLTVYDLVQKFTKAPFGWKDVAVIHIVAQLNKRNRRVLEYSNQPRFPLVDFVEKAISSAERTRCVVKASENIDQATLHKVAAAYREVFNKDLKHTDESDKLFDEMKAELEKEHTHYTELKDKYYNEPFARHFDKLQHRLEQWKNTREPKALYTTLMEQQEETIQMVDNAKEVAGFADRFIKDYRKVKSFEEQNRDNFASLPEAEEQKAVRIRDFYKSDSPARDFRHIHKAYEELEKELKNLIKQLKEEATQQYIQVFDELEKEATKLEITDTQVYADRSTYLSTIKSSTSISKLKLHLANLGGFHTKQLETIVSYASKKPQPSSTPSVKGGNGSTTSAGTVSVVNEPVQLQTSRKIIKNEEEMEAYLSELRETMTQMLRDNKTIII